MMRKQTLLSFVLFNACSDTQAEAEGSATDASTDGATGSDSEGNGTTRAGETSSAGTQTASETQPTSGMESTDTGDDASGDTTATGSTGDTDGMDACMFSNPGLRFGTAGFHGVGPEPLGIALGDLDEDGHADLAIAVNDAQAIHVLVSAGNWQTPERVVLDLDGLYPSAVQLGDMNGDGHLDVVASGVHVFLGDGDGGFEHLGMFEDQSGGFSYGMVLADLDSDDDLDVALANLQGADVSILHNDGTGALTFTQGIMTGQGWSIDAGDLDGDGDADLLVGVDDVGPQDLELLRNDGAGGFTGPEHYANTTVVDYVRAADMDGDGDLDAVLATHAEPWLSWLENDGSGTTWTEHAIDHGPATPDGLQVADMDADGDNDIVSVGYTSALVYDNDGDGNFTWTRGRGGIELDRVVLGDVDGDGRLDLAALGTERNLVAVLLGNGVDAPRAPNSLDTDDEPNAVALGDFDGDMTIDAAVSATGIAAGLEIARNPLAPGAFFEDLGGTIGDPRDVAAGDFNGDGLLDAVMVGVQDHVNVATYDGRGEFDLHNSMIFGSGNAVQATDIDGDGKVDAVVIDSCYIRLARGDGTGTVEIEASVSVDASYCYDGAVADLDDDGNTDVLVAHLSPAGVSVAMGLGGLDFSAPVVVPLGSGVIGIGVVDADGDDDPDAWAIHGGAVTLLVNEGGTLVAGPSLELPTPAQVGAAADLDGDGDVEVAVSSAESDRVYIVDLLGGAPELVRELVFATPRGIALGDFDGDCAPEIAVAGGSTERVTIVPALP